MAVLARNLGLLLILLALAVSMASGFLLAPTPRSSKHATTRPSTTTATPTTASFPSLLQRFAAGDGGGDEEKKKAVQRPPQQLPQSQLSDSMRQKLLRCVGKWDWDLE